MVSFCAGGEVMFKMQHVETFDCTGTATEFEEFVRDKVLPYWRRRGFKVRIYRTEAALGPSQYWLVTAIDNFGSIDSWTQMAVGEREGRELMEQYLSLVQNVRASVIRDIES